MSKDSPAKRPEKPAKKPEEPAKNLSNLPEPVGLSEESSTIGCACSNPPLVGHK